MPRTSADAVALAGVAIPAPVARLEPPPELSDTAAAVFRAIVDRMPPDWFAGEHGPLLEAYCTHATYARTLAAEIDSALAGDGLLGEEGSAVVSRLMKLHALQSERLTSLATKLRLSPQANKAPQQARNQLRAHPSTPKPWEAWGEGQPQ